MAEYFPDDVKTLLKAGYTPLSARVLCSRGFTTPEAASGYLSGDTEIYSPFLLREMKAAADRVRLAVARRERIIVFGDYDVDGITATCLLTDYLRSVGARVDHYIPARLEEGYGLNESAIRWLYRQQVNLIITVDCGITANDEAELCKKLGIDLVITDHHECKDDLPRACAVVDPHRKDRTYPHTDLSGVGIAFKLACAIGGDREELLDRYCDLLALGLVADVMPLRGEVRALVIRGLKSISEMRRPGIAALMKEAGCAGQPATAGTIGYTLAPRINAAGRMGKVDLAVDLFLAESEEEAAELAGTLCALNRERQSVEAGIYAEAVRMLPAGDVPGAIVLAGETWHQGVVGIVASRLSEEYACPAFLICMDGNKGKASSRSYGGFNLFSALTELSGLLESYGGHELAAGFTIERSNLDVFRERMTALAQRYAASGKLETALRVDCEISPELLTIDNVNGLDALEPCGSGCPSPVFCVSNLSVEQLSEVGGGKHLRLRLRYGRNPYEAVTAMFFSTTALSAGVSLGDCIDVAFTPQVNEYRGTRTVQLNVVDIRPCASERAQEQKSAELYRRFRESGNVSAREAETMLPSRSECVQVWRYLIRNSENNLLSEEYFCLCRKINRSLQNGPALSPVKIRVCLDAFEETGLVSIHRQQRLYRISVSPETKKVDLATGASIRTLNDIIRNR